MAAAALLVAGTAAGPAAASSAAVPAAAKDFVQTESGLRVQDVRAGSGATPQQGDNVSIHWSGYTAGYQAKRIDNTSRRDEPFDFVLGQHQVIPAIEEAVLGMQAGGIRRVEIRGEHPELSYPRPRNERFGPDGKYRLGPQPHDLGGQRALDFVLDNPTLQPFNRTLLIDISLLSVRKRS
eukprot:jgi/Astpho2/5084/Aster-08020